MSAITSPVSLPSNPDQPTVFLGGSIDNGKATNWQAEVIADHPNNILFINPRRDNWNPHPHADELVEQIEWELDALDAADAILIYYVPDSLSPISLLEMGLFARLPSKLIVCCPPGFWRRTNVQVVCKRFGVTCYDVFDDAILGVIWRARTNFDARNSA